MGPSSIILALTILVAFGAAILAFFAWPHWAVAITIPVFAALPSLKVLVTPTLGPVKDGIVLAAVVAAGLVTIRRSASGRGHPADRWVVTAVLFLMALYFFNLGGSLNAANYDAAWMQGVRLAYEPLLLLLVGLTLESPRRTLRWAAWSLVTTASVVALYGLAQQALGHAQLRELGYEYNVQIRFFIGQLRSFGSLDDPFAYA